MNVHQLQCDDNHRPQKQLETSEIANQASPEQLPGSLRQRQPHQHPQRASHDPRGGGKPPELREHEHPRHHCQQQRRLRLGGMSKQTKSKPRRPTELARVASFVRELRHELSPPPAEGLGFHSCSFRGAPSFQLPVRHYHHQLHQGGGGAPPSIGSLNAAYAEDLSRIGTAMSLPPSTVGLAKEASGNAHTPRLPATAGPAYHGDHSNVLGDNQGGSSGSPRSTATTLPQITPRNVPVSSPVSAQLASPAPHGSHPDVRLLLSSEDLMNYGMPSTMIERVYRLVEFFCAGFHNLCAELVKSSDQPAPLLSKIWTVFARQAEHVFKVQYGSDLAHLLEELDQQQLAMTEALAQAISETREHSVAHHLVESALKEARESIASLQTKHDTLQQQAAALQEQVARGQSNLKEEAILRRIIEKELEPMAELNSKCAWQTRQIWEVRTQLETMQRNQDIKESEMQGLRQSLAEKEEQLGAAKAEQRRLLENLQATKASPKQSAKTQMEATAEFDERLETIIQERVQEELSDAPIGPTNEIEIEDLKQENERQRAQLRSLMQLLNPEDPDSCNSLGIEDMDDEEGGLDEEQEAIRLKSGPGTLDPNRAYEMHNLQVNLAIVKGRNKKMSAQLTEARIGFNAKLAELKESLALQTSHLDAALKRNATLEDNLDRLKQDNAELKAAACQGEAAMEASYQRHALEQEAVLAATRNDTAKYKSQLEGCQNELSNLQDQFESLNKLRVSDNRVSKMVLSYFSETVRDRAKEKVQAALRQQETVSLLQHVQVMWTTLRSQLQAQLQAAMDKGASLEQDFAQVAIQDAEAEHRRLTAHLTAHVHALHRGLKNSMEAHRQIEQLVDSLVSLDQNKAQEPDHNTGSEQMHADCEESTVLASATLQPAPPSTSPKSNAPAPVRGRSLTSMSASSRTPTPPPLPPEQHQNKIEDIEDKEVDAAETHEAEGELPCVEELGRKHTPRTRATVTAVKLDPRTRARLAELEARVARLAVRRCATEKLWLAAVLESGGTALPGEVEQAQDDTGTSFAAVTRWQAAGAGLGATTKDVKLREETLVHRAEGFAQRHLLSLARRALNIQCQVRHIVRARRLADQSTRNPERLDEEALDAMSSEVQQVPEQEADPSLDNDPSWAQWWQDHSDAERMQALETDIVNLQVEYFAAAWNSSASDAARVKIQRVNTVVEATVKTMMKSLARDVKLFRLTDVEDSLERLHQDLTYTLSTEQPQLRKLRHAVNQVLQDKVSKDQTNVKEELAKVQRERLGEAERMRNAHVAARLPLKMAVEALAHSEAHYQAVRARACAESALLQGSSYDPNKDSLNQWVASARAQVMARRAACAAEHVRSLHRMGALHIWQAEQDLAVVNLVQAALVAAYNKDVGLGFRLEHKEVISRARALRERLQNALDGMIGLEADQATNAAMLLAEYARLQSLACAALPVGPQHSANTLHVIPAHRRWEGIMLDQGVVVAQTEMVKAISALAQTDAEACSLNHMQRMAHARLVALAPEDESIDELGPNSKDGEVIDSANQQQENELYMQQQQAATAVIEAVHDAYKPAQQRVRELIAVVHESERRLVAAIHVAGQSTVLNIQDKANELKAAKAEVSENMDRIFHALTQVNSDDQCNLPIQAQELALLEAEGPSLRAQQNRDTCVHVQPGLGTSISTSSFSNQGSTDEPAAAVGSPEGRSSPDASISKMPQSTNQQSSQADPLEPSQRLLVDFVMRRLDIISSGEDLARVGGVPGELLNLQSQEEIVLELMQCLPIVKDSQLVLVKALNALERDRMVNEQPPSSIKDADKLEPTHQAGAPDSTSQECKAISGLAQIGATGEVEDNEHCGTEATTCLHRKNEYILRLQNSLQAVLHALSAIQKPQVLPKTHANPTAQSGEQTDVAHCASHVGVLEEGYNDGEQERDAEGGDDSVQCADSPLLAGVFGAAFAKLRGAIKLKVMQQQQQQSQNAEREQQPLSAPSSPNESPSLERSRSADSASSIDLDSAPSCHSPPVAPPSRAENAAFGRRFSLPVYVGVNAYVQDARTPFEDMKTLSRSMADQIGSSESPKRRHIQGGCGDVMPGPESSLRTESKHTGQDIEPGLSRVHEHGACNRSLSHIKNGAEQTSQHVGGRFAKHSATHFSGNSGTEDHVPEEGTFVDMMPLLPKYRCFRDGLYILELPQELGVWKISKNMHLLGISGLGIDKGNDFPGFLIPPVNATEVMKVAQQITSSSNILSGIHPPAGFVKQKCSGPWWAAQGAWAHRTGTLDWLAATQPLGMNSPRALPGLAEQFHPAVHALDEEVLDENMEFDKTERLPPGLDSQVWGATRIEKLMQRAGISRPSG